MSLNIKRKLEKLRGEISPQVRDLDEFTLAYLWCALWSSTDDNGEPLDADYSVHDFDPETLCKAVEECRSFQESHWDYIYHDLSRAGHDFWLTRNGHGAGFWDGDWEKLVGDLLTRASKSYGEVDLYVGDDGKIYGV